MKIDPHHLRHAVSALAAIIQSEVPADATMHYYFRDHRAIGHRDRARIADLVYAVLRRKRLLEHLAAPATPRRLVLAGLVKLRGVSLRELRPLLGEDEYRWLAGIKAVAGEDLPLVVQADLPDWMADRLPADELLDIGRGFQQEPPLDLRVNTLRADRDGVRRELAAAGSEAHPTPYSPVGLRLNRWTPLRQHALFRQGAIELQDEGSQLVAALVGAQASHRVVDFCAGAGGKTLALGALMGSQGRLYAFDVSGSRLDQLRQRLKRSGLSNVQVKVIGSENDAAIKRLRGEIDRVLVDAPCSGCGTLRRNPDIKWRPGAGNLTEIVDRQAAILRSAAGLVKPGGRLVYATCSLLPEENEHQVATFLAAHPDFHRRSAASILAEQGIALDTGDYLQLTPHRHGTDGFFAAVLERC